jgi:hypothetical protein
LGCTRLCADGKDFSQGDGKEEKTRAPDRTKTTGEILGAQFLRRTTAVIFLPA